MNSADNIITAVRTIVEAMTPVVTITSNTASGSNWILTACRTYWVVPGSYVEIGSESFRVESIVFNESITVSGDAQPVGDSFQLAAPDFNHGSSRKVDNERKMEDDVTNMFVYLPRPRVREDGRYDSDIAYTASIRPLFLIGYDTTRDNTDDQQSDFIDPMNAAADLFEFIIDNNNDKFEETEFYNREEWMNFGNPAVWGNDSLIFDAPLSGVELSLDLIVLKDFACLCDGAEPVTCPDVTHSFQGADTGITTSPGGNFNVSVVDQFGADTGTKTSETPNEVVITVSGGGTPDPVTQTLNNGAISLTDTPSGENVDYQLLNSEDLEITPTVDTDTANNKILYFDNPLENLNGVAIDGPLVGNVTPKEIETVDTDGTVLSPTVLTNTQETLRLEFPKTKNVSNPIKSGAADLGSFVSNDDADTNFGRLSDFFTLDSNNPFGHAFRFTGKTGGYWNGTNWVDVNGTVTTEALAFPDDIMLDWAHEQQSVKVLAIQRTPLASDSQSNFLSNSPYTLDTYSDWYLLNIPEAVSLYYFGVFRDPYNYPPLNHVITGALDYIWTSYKDNAGGGWRVANTQIGVTGATLTHMAFIRRFYTYAELGL